MTYDMDSWIKRIRSRSDMSSYLYHLTREDDNDNDSFDVLINILNDKKLNGSTTESGFIVGDNKAVCFQDTTTYGLCQNIYHEQILREKNSQRKKVRYRPIGIAFRKEYVYDKGGRPVIYEKTDVAKELIPKKDEWWRIVNLDLSNTERIIDWTHEREWRVKGDFEFALNEAVIVLTNSDIYREFVSKIDKSILENIAGIIVLDPILT